MPSSHGGAWRWSGAVVNLCTAVQKPAQQAPATADIVRGSHGGCCPQHCSGEGVLTYTRQHILLSCCHPPLDKLGMRCNNHASTGAAPRLYCAQTAPHRPCMGNRRRNARRRLKCTKIVLKNCRDAREATAQLIRFQVLPIVSLDKVAAPDDATKLRCFTSLPSVMHSPR